MANKQLFIYAYHNCQAVSGRFELNKKNGKALKKSVMDLKSNVIIETQESISFYGNGYRSQIDK